MLTKELFLILLSEKNDNNISFTLEYMYTTPHNGPVYGVYAKLSNGYSLITSDNNFECLLEAARIFKFAYLLGQNVG